tara:strand:- start:413 stop:661 length:249 start_codon:yes stop_codon:yes gene_type:complete
MKTLALIFIFATIGCGSAVDSDFTKADLLSCTIMKRLSDDGSLPVAYSDQESLRKYIAAQSYSTLSLSEIDENHLTLSYCDY